MRRALVLVLVACRAAPPAQPVTVTATTSLSLAAEQVVDEGDTTYVLAHDKIAIVRDSSVVTTMPLREGPPFVAAASIEALDGDGRWIVGVRGGALWRVHVDGELESIADRFGLGGERITGVAGAATTTAIAFERGMAVTMDGTHLARYRTTGRVAAAANRVAIATDSAVEVWNLARGTTQTYDLRGAWIDFADASSPSARLVAHSTGTLWIERDGKLQTLGRADAVAVSGAHVWASLGDRLLVVDHDRLVATSARAPQTLHGSTNGDVWAGALQRFSLEHRSDPAWQTEVAPVFQRVCAHCHLPGGDADFDLSTAAAWRTARDEIAKRVLVDRTMPPAGTTLTDADRGALEHWLRSDTSRRRTD